MDVGLWHRFFTTFTYLFSAVILFSLFFGLDVNQINSVYRINGKEYDLIEVAFYLKIFFSFYFLLGILSFFRVPYFFLLLTIFSFNPVVWIFNFYYMKKKNIF